MKWPPTNFKQSLVSIIIINRILGLRSFDCFSGRLKRMVSLTYILLMLGTLLVSVKIELDLVDRASLLPLEVLMYKLLTELNIMVICYSVMAGWWFTKSFDKFIERMMKIDDTLKLLGMPTDHRQTSYDCYKSILNANIFLLIILGTFWKWLALQYRGFTLFFMTITFCITFFTTEVMTLDFYICVKALKRRFKAVNHLLISLFANSHSSRNSNEDDSTHMIEKLNAWLVLTVKSKVKDGELRRTIHTIKQVHLELVRVSMMLCHIFRIQMTLEMGLATVFLTSIVYYVYVRCMANGEVNFTLMQMSSSIVWCFAYGIRLILVNSSCEETVIEANRTSTAIHALHGMQIDPELKNEIQQFALQIMLRPLKFSIFGFSLSYAFVRSCFGAVTTYSLIMIQMSNDLAAALDNGARGNNKKMPSYIV